MKKTITSSIFLILTATLNLSFASTSYDVTYCSPCSQLDMQKAAVQKLGKLSSETVFVINKSTNEINSFVVTKNEADKSKISVKEHKPSQKQIMLVTQAIKNMQSIKKKFQMPMRLDDMQYHNNPLFPKTAHAMVSNDNAVYQLTDFVSNTLSKEANHNLMLKHDELLQSLAKYVTATNLLIGHPIFIEFDDGSSVDLVISDVSIDGVSGNSIVSVEKVPNSMKDYKNNRLPDDAKDLLGRQINLGEGKTSTANISGWVTMLNRLKKLNYPSGKLCSLVNKNQISCALK